MDLLPLADTLETAGLGIKAETIFVNMIPVECPQGILLRNKLTGTPINYELPGYYKSRFQLIVRSGSYLDGKALYDQAATALTLNEVQVGAMYVKFSRPLTMPVTFPLSNGNLIEHAADFEIVFLA